MSLAKDRTHTSDYVQQERIIYHLSEITSNLEDLSKSVREAQIDLFHVVRQLEDLKGVVYATK